MDFVEELKILGNMKLTVIPITNGTQGAIHEWLVNRLEDLEIIVKVTTQVRALKDRREYREESLRLEEICCHSDSSENPPANTRVKHPQNSKREINTSTLLENWKKTMEYEGDNYTNRLWSFGRMTNGLLKGPEDLSVGSLGETIQTTELLKTARILRRVLEIWGDLLLLNLKWKTISIHWCQNL